MCGIAGIVDLRGQRVDQAILKKMADTLSHRGPDAEGFYCSPAASRPLAVGLAHRRLSIIDIATGQQPLANEDGTVWIVFNGEIYNYLAVRNELISKGHRFRTNSDTETIVHAYEEWGEGCVTRLRGMFAFAIWDENRQELFAARDRLGIKPFYYCQNDTTFLFASEIKAIVAHPFVKREIDPLALADYFTLLYIPAPKSIFKSIRKLPAGHTLTLGANGQLRIRQYWDITFTPDYTLTENQWSEKIIEKLTESIKIRLMSEVPLGAFLSGGIDSSAVVALMSGLMNEPVKTSSIGFNEDKFNELPYAREIAERFHADHHVKTIKANAAEILDKLTWYYDEPFADSSALPTYYVCQVAKEKVSVCLSGDGGDENFAGYRRYYYDRLENQVRGIFPLVFRQNVIGPLARIYPKMDWAPQVFRAKTLLTNLSLSPAEGFFNTMSWFQGQRDSLFSADMHAALGGYSSLTVFEELMKKAPTDPLSAIQYIDMKTYMVEDILTKVDRASMAHSLEVRVPIIDHEFMELVARIPSGLKLHGKVGKYIFKKALETTLPQETLYRKKMGFSIPLSRWLRNELKLVFEETVFGESSLEIGNILNMQTIGNLWDAHQAGSRDFGSELWAILFFAKWHRNICGSNDLL